jgi:hypothetical protein
MRDKVRVYSFSRITAVDAIIFLAPISGFDQVLVEDKNVNRLVSYSNFSLLLSLIYAVGRLCTTMESSLFKQTTCQCGSSAFLEQM